MVPCLALFYISVNLLDQWALLQGKLIGMVDRWRPHMSLALGSVLNFHLLISLFFIPSPSLFPVIAEEDIESVEEGVFDVHL